MIWRAALLAAAGAAAAIGYLASRQKAPMLYRRRLDLASLPRHVDNWLPKVPYVPYLRVGVDDRDLLEITGDGTTVTLDLLSDASRTSDVKPAFRRACAMLGHPVIDPARRRSDVAQSTEIPADAAAVCLALETVLRDVFGLGPSSRLIVAVPAGA